ncbi:BTB/POZ domain-containing protein At3g08570 [Triticum aestivum]|uniref:BTB/POZ domain-containing protein At3g08570 n=1 Tax=Triticum aestivum TaxID=4565 RepID=UPI001D030CA3|nr:BTB/POZ domain-containing protein At3g08570-like [Triticum aestivum]
MPEGRRDHQTPPSTADGPLSPRPRSFLNWLAQALFTRIPKRYYHPSWGEQLPHKLPLASKCGYIRKLVSGANGSRVTHLEITGMPGDAKAFDLVIKFCYGINFEITTDTIARLRCATEHLEMTKGVQAREPHRWDRGLPGGGGTGEPRGPRSAGPGPRSSSRRPTRCRSLAGASMP